MVPLTTQDGGPILYMSEGRSTCKCHLPSTESIFPWPRVTPDEEALTSRESVLPGCKDLQDLPTNRSRIWTLESSCNLKGSSSLLPGNQAEPSGSRGSLCLVQCRLEKWNTKIRSEGDTLIRVNILIHGPEGGNQHLLRVLDLGDILR